MLLHLSQKWPGAQAEGVLLQKLVTRVSIFNQLDHTSTPACGTDAHKRVSLRSEQISQEKRILIRRPSLRLPNSPNRALARDFSNRNCVSVRFISAQIRSCDCSSR